MDSKAVTPVKTLEEIRKIFAGSTTANDPDVVLRNADKEIGDGTKPFPTEPESNVFKAMSLHEFDNGMLLTTIVAEQYKTFGVNLLRDLKKEYNCRTASECSLAELAAVNYIRTLEIQHRIDRYLAMGTFTDMGVRYIAVLSKELDRANKHYLQTIQALKTMRQPQLQLSIRTQTAVIGQNQVVQNKN